MNQEGTASGAPPGVATSSGPASRGLDLAAMSAALGEADICELSGPELIDLIRGLEELKGAAAALQAECGARFDALVKAEEEASGIPSRHRGRTVAAQVALARRESPAKGSHLLGLAKALSNEMPHTLAALRSGLINEWRAAIVTRETACLTLEDRATVDEELFSNPITVEGMGDRRLAAAAKAIAMRLDNRAVAARAAKAESERHVTCRPAPDTMTWLSALLPVRQGVAVFAALCRAADEARAAGDPRSRGQVMADTVYERVTGRSHAEPQDVHLQVVMTDRTLLEGDVEPAWIADYGPVPAGVARELVSGKEGKNQSGGERQALVWVRRLYVAPESGDLVAMDARTRRLPSVLREFVRTRDRTCRTPWCDAPIRHDDHIAPWSRGGPTTTENVQGLCERCNYVKEQPGWTATARRPMSTTGASRHTVETRTPTGHTYRSTAPQLPGMRSSRNRAG